MSQPSIYARQFSFSGFSASQPSDQQPGIQIDAEFNAVKLTTDQILTNLKLIQRDDGALANGSVTLTQLASDVLLTLGSSWTVRGAWVSTTVYNVGDVVSHAGSTYVCCTPHTSGDFTTDLGAIDWIAIYGSAAITGYVAKAAIANVGSFTRANLTINADGLVVAASSGSAGGLSYAHFACRQNVGVDSGETLTVTGTLTSTRVINTTVLNTISGASISANKITLPAGTFKITAHATARAGGGSAQRLGVYDFTHSTQLLIGPPSYLTNTNCLATVIGVVILTGSTQLQINHQVEKAATGGVAIGAAGALKEEYVTVTIEQFA